MIAMPSAYSSASTCVQPPACAARPAVSVVSVVSVPSPVVWSPEVSSLGDRGLLVTAGRLQRAVCLPSGEGASALTPLSDSTRVHDPLVPSEL